jgi:hypothetical protein
MDTADTTVDTYPRNRRSAPRTPRTRRALTRCSARDRTVDAPTDSRGHAVTVDRFVGLGDPHLSGHGHDHPDMNARKAPTITSTTRPTRSNPTGVTTFDHRRLARLAEYHAAAAAAAAALDALVHAINRADLDLSQADWLTIVRQLGHCAPSRRLLR